MYRNTSHCALHFSAQMAAHHQHLFRRVCTSGWIKVKLQQPVQELSPTQFSQAQTPTGDLLQLKITLGNLCKMPMFS